MLELMEKYNMGGHQSASKNGSEMLFGENDSNEKRCTKPETKSVIGGTKSVAGSVSRSKRSSTGKFEGNTRFGDNCFKKKGKNDSGKQKW
jgi:hypothetical protein